QAEVGIRDRNVTGYQTCALSICSAVRSKVRSQSIFDKIWNFFTSIKIGVTIIALIAIAAAIGTILPQEYFIPVGVDPLQYYTERSEERRVGRAWTDLLFGLGGKK